MIDIDVEVICRKKVTVPANSQVPIDTILLSALKFTTYSISYESQDKTISRGLKLNLYKDDINCATQVYGMSGSCMDIGIDCSENAGNVELIVTNNEAYSVNICFAKVNL